VSNIDAEPPGLGDASHEALQERNALVYHWSVRGDGRGAVQEREHVGMGQAERDMEIPRSPQVLDWVVRKWAGRLFSSVGGERVASDRFEQSLHIAEVAIDRGRLHSGGGAYRSRGDQAAWRLLTRPAGAGVRRRLGFAVRGTDGDRRQLQRIDRTLGTKSETFFEKP